MKNINLDILKIWRPKTSAIKDTRFSQQFLLYFISELVYETKVYTAVVINSSNINKTNMLLNTKKGGCPEDHLGIKNRIKKIPVD